MVHCPVFMGETQPRPLPYRKETHMSDVWQLDHGPCWVCGAEATDRCDDPEVPGRDPHLICERWICHAHLVIEAQHWDRRGWDGVDVRCHAHRHLSLDVRDVFRGSGLPPAPRFEGTELLTAY